MDSALSWRFAARRSAPLMVVLFLLFWSRIPAEAGIQTPLTQQFNLDSVLIHYQGLIIAHWNLTEDKQNHPPGLHRIEEEFDRR